MSTVKAGTEFILTKYRGRGPEQTTFKSRKAKVNGFERHIEVFPAAPT